MLLRVMVELVRGGETVDVKALLKAKEGIKVEPKAPLFRNEQDVRAFMEKVRETKFEGEAKGCQR